MVGTYICLVTIKLLLLLKTDIRKKIYLGIYRVIIFGVKLKMKLIFLKTGYGVKISIFSLKFLFIFHGAFGNYVEFFTFDPQVPTRFTRK